MPCSDGWGDDSKFESEDRNTAVRLACEACWKMERDKIPIPQWAQGWWSRHKESDRKRASHEAEIKRKVAISKLSAEDRMVLGL